MNVNPEVPLRGGNAVPIEAALGQVIADAAYRLLDWADRQDSTFAATVSEKGNAHAARWGFGYATQVAAEVRVLLPDRPALEAYDGAELVEVAQFLLRQSLAIMRQHVTSTDRNARRRSGEQARAEAAGEIAEAMNSALGYPLGYGV